MKRLLIYLLKRRIKRAIKHKQRLTNSIVISAYDNMINNYKHTIIYIESEKD